MMLKENLHKLFVKNQEKIQDWFESKIQSEDYPFYCSFDIRESGYKIAPVDANLFPAGFNNICQADREVMGDLLNRCAEFQDLEFKNVGIFCEGHTGNPYYWDNVHALMTLFESQGNSVSVFLPTQNPEIKDVESASGKKIVFSNVKVKEGLVYVGKEEVQLDFILSNNDFSTAYNSWISEVTTPQLPPLYMGWHQRRKHSFFNFYNSLVDEFCAMLEIDPFQLRVETKSFNDFKIEDRESVEALGEEVHLMKQSLGKSYRERSIDFDPYMFVKNSHGTYGLGVIEVKNKESVLEWNYKARKKMKATKGGGGVSSVIIQEGIPTSLTVDESPAEAVIYLLGCGLAGGFLRTHGRKGELDSLNSPGAVFKRMCFSDYEDKKETMILENVYGTIARLGALALSLEIRAAKS